MSKTTSSPGPISRSPGSACGSAPLAPAATIARERRLGAELADTRLGGAGDLALGAAGEPALDRPAVDVVGQLRGLGDRGQLVFVLDPAQRLDRVAGRRQLDAVGRLLLQLLELAHTDVTVLEAQPSVEIRSKTWGRSSRPTSGRSQPSPTCLGCALDVAEVGEEDAQALADQRRRRWFR